MWRKLKSDVSLELNCQSFPVDGLACGQFTDFSVRTSAKIGHWHISEQRRSNHLRFATSISSGGTQRLFVGNDAKGRSGPVSQCCR
jgi:hypothetical protein